MLGREVFETMTVVPIRHGQTAFRIYIIFIKSIREEYPTIRIVVLTLYQRSFYMLSEHRLIAIISDKHGNSPTSRNIFSLFGQSCGN